MRHEVIDERRNALGQLEVETLWLLTDLEVQQLQRTGLAPHVVLGENVLTQVHHILSPARSAVRGHRIATRVSDGWFAHSSGIYLPVGVDPDDRRLWRYARGGLGQRMWVRDDGTPVPAWGFVPPKHFDTRGRDPEWLDPQWVREAFARDPAVEVAGVAAWKGGLLDRQLTEGSHIDRRQNTTYSDQVGAGADDAYEYHSGSGFNSSQFYAYCTANTTEANRAISGHRFDSATIAGAIYDARITVQAYSTSFDNFLVDIYAEDVDDSDDFSTTADVYSRALTTASERWNETSIGTAEHEVPVDLSEVVQEVALRGGWASGNALTIMLDGAHSSIRNSLTSSYDRGSTYPIKIDVDYFADAPVVLEVLEGGQGDSGVDDFDVTAPAAVDAGDRLLLCIAMDGSTTVAENGSSDWTAVSSGNDGGNISGAIFELICDGTEDAATWNFLMSAQEGAAYQLYHIRGAHASQAAEVGTAATGADGAPDPPSVTASWGAEDANLFVAFAAVDSNTITAFPSGYFKTGELDSDTLGSTDSVSAGIAALPANSASANPGAFTISNDQWWAQTIVIRPAAAGPTEVAITGSKPAGAGALALQGQIAIGGSKPAGSGGLALQETFAVAGNKPATNGVLALQEAYALAGSKPAGAGEVAAAMTAPVVGSKPAASGVLALVETFALAGSKPAGAGVLGLVETFALAGSKPAGAGVVVGTYTIQIAGSKPASSGVLALAVQIAIAGNKPAHGPGVLGLTAQIAIAGNKPAGAGAIIGALAAIPLTGSKPAGAGVIALAAQIALAGSKPAGIGTLALLELYALTGSKPAGSGVLGLVGQIALAGSKPAGSGLIGMLATIALVGVKPASSGTIALVGVIAIAGSKPAGEGAIAVPIVAVLITVTIDGTQTLSPTVDGTQALAVTVDGTQSITLTVDSE